MTWGVLHGFYQVAGEMLTPARERIYAALHLRKETAGFIFWKILGTYMLVCFGPVDDRLKLE